MMAQRNLVPEGSAIAKALDYSLGAGRHWLYISRTALCPSIITRSKSDKAVGTWTLELVVRRVNMNRPEFRRHLFALN